MLLSTGRFFSTAAAAPPSGDPSFSSVVLLLGFEGADGATTTTDESPTTPHAITFTGNAQIDTAQSKFGASSLLLDGSGDRLDLADNADWDFGSGEFTVELWVRFNAVAAAVQCFWAQWNTTFGRRSWRFEYSGTGTNLLRFRYSTTSANDIAISGAWTPSTNTWYHVAACRSGNTLRLFVNGVMVATADLTGITFSNPAQTIWIGAGDNGATHYVNGWMDEFRITKGVGRYTSDGGFTVPAAAFPRS